MMGRFCTTWLLSTNQRAWISFHNGTYTLLVGQGLICFLYGRLDAPRNESSVQANFLYSYSPEVAIPLNVMYILYLPTCLSPNVERALVNVRVDKQERNFELSTVEKDRLHVECQLFCRLGLPSFCLEASKGMPIASIASWSHHWKQDSSDY